MTFEQIIFYLFSAVLLAAAVGMVTVRSPVYAALCLILSFFTSAALWLLLEAEFLGLVLVLVYVGAVMVLFLFVIMMLDLNTDPLKEGLVKHAPVGFGVALVIAVEMIMVLQSAHALASGTVWSTSSARAEVVTDPDHGSSHSPVATVHAAAVVYVTATRDSAARTSARVSRQSPSSSIQSPNRSRS